MPLYQYVKIKPKNGIKIPRYFPFLLISIGSAILLWVVWPIISFSLFTAPLFAKTISPVPEFKPINQAGGDIVTNIFAQTSIDSDKTKFSDFTNANIWFPTKPQKKIVAPVNSYTLTIPKLKISNALVIIAGDDLNKGLIHYGGTALPGTYGNAVIFGHSTLPQFFNPINYRTIFSTLPTIKIGDEIIVTFDNVTYTYSVYDLAVTEPSDLSILEQRFDDSYVTLITCVPPGTYLKRLAVRGKLKRI